MRQKLAKTHHISLLSLVQTMARHQPDAKASYLVRKINFSDNQNTEILFQPDHVFPWGRIPTTYNIEKDDSMMTSSNGNIFRVTGPLCGEFTGLGELPTQRPVTRSFGVFLDLRMNKRSSKQWWGWWFETPSWSLWRQCNGIFSCFLFSKARVTAQRQ